MFISFLNFRSSEKNEQTKDAKKKNVERAIGLWFPGGRDRVAGGGAVTERACEVSEEKNISTLRSKRALIPSERLGVKWLQPRNVASFAHFWSTKTCYWRVTVDAVLMLSVQTIKNKIRLT